MTGDRELVVLDEDHANAAGASITASTGTNWADPVQDAVGNMTTLPKPSDLANGLTCKYDAWNRLVEVKDGDDVVAKYEYDGLNRRIKRHIDSQSPAAPDGIDKYVHYYYNTAWQIVETRDSIVGNDDDEENTAPESLQPKYQYAHSFRYIDAVVTRFENTDTDGLCDDKDIYYQNDANFNVTKLIDGVVLERYTYDPYGNVKIYDKDWNTRTSSSHNNEFLYTGRERDTETGLYHYRNRYYSADLGRFVSRDPIGYDAGDVNLYRYVGNQPLTFTDPNGKVVFVVGGVAFCVYFFWPDTANAPAPGDATTPSNPHEGLVPAAACGVAAGAGCHLLRCTGWGTGGGAASAGGTAGTAGLSNAARMVVLRHGNRAAAMAALAQLQAIRDCYSRGTRAFMILTARMDQLEAAIAEAWPIIGR